MPHAARGVGASHLAVLARAPRPAGSAAEEAARDYAARVLGEAGFTVTRERFEYSRFPGRAATPLGGALLAATILLSASLGLRGAAGAAAAALVLGGVTVAAFARAMLGDAVLTLPWQRASSENLVATWGTERPTVWLVAHLDSKSQPVPSLMRVAGITLLAAATALALLASLLQLAALPHRTAWWSATALVLLGAPVVLASVVGARSNGAVDNASGVAAVLAAAVSVRPETMLGVLLPSAEELGLAGARAWARNARPATALNCDGVDDAGVLTIMYSGAAPTPLILTLKALARGSCRVRRMPPGLLTDSVALADRGWATVTVSRGSLATLRRVHTPADSLATLRGDGIDEVAALLARAAEVLA
jgi:acetylornithine deacetylase/succinyl-diaminopimelate desuccinylase-like protein